MAVLMGEDKELNPNENIYITPGRADKKGRGGMISPGGGTGAYVDAWGEEFYIRFDTDNDERIENPNTGSQTKLIFEHHVINPRDNSYISPAQNYLSPDNALIDPWGTPYHVHIDTTFNGRITNPQPDADTPEIYDNALIYSAGPDCDPATWHDNFTSWN